jgi:8-oxo-dGTP diphosphatase
VHRPRYDDWSLPKGKLDAGEPHVVAALREIREETGHEGVAGVGLGTTSYDVLLGGRPVPKTVRWWSVRADGGAFVPGSEVDELHWLPPPEALLRIGESAPLRRWMALPPDPALVLLVRHASAGDPGSWRGPDELRPLDDKGLGQVELLTTVLRCFGPVRVVSAPPVRCQDTVGPVAAALGLDVELDAQVSEDGAPARPERHVAGLVRPGDAVVVCSQGGVIPRVVEALDPSRRPAAARKGSLWVLAFDGEALLSSDDSVLL